MLPWLEHEHLPATLSRGRTYYVQVEAYNQEAWSDLSPLLEVEIPNVAPTASGTIDDIAATAGGAVEVVHVESAFTDSDDRQLRFTAASGNEAVATVSVQGSRVLVSPLTQGTATITVTAHDSGGNSIDSSFEAAVAAASGSAPTLSISGDVLTAEFTDDFAARETRAYEVRLRHQTPVGPWETACTEVVNNSDSASNVSVTMRATTADFFEPGIAYEADYAYVGTDCSDEPAARSTTAVATTTQGHLPLTSRWYTRVRLLRKGCARHSRPQPPSGTGMITHGLPNQRISEEDRQSLAAEITNVTIPRVVDDVHVFVRVASIDGESGTLGRAAPHLVREGTSLPVVVEIVIDSDDEERLSDANLQELVEHELGHAVGFFGTAFRANGLLQDPSHDGDNVTIFPVEDTHFSGSQAVAAFDAAGGSGYSSAKVPLENTHTDSRNSHWRESAMGNELMTPLLQTGESNPFSAITIKALADMGHRVDAATADTYSLPQPSMSGRLRAKAGADDSELPADCLVEAPAFASGTPQSSIEKIEGSIERP